jgi:hypothetical protein
VEIDHFGSMKERSKVEFPMQRGFDLDITYVSPDEISTLVDEMLPVPPKVRENLQFLSQSKR